MRHDVHMFDPPRIGAQVMFIQKHPWRICAEDRLEVIFNDGSRADGSVVYATADEAVIEIAGRGWRIGRPGPEEPQITIANVLTGGYWVIRSEEANP